jgi:hypothetical protein
MCEMGLIAAAADRFTRWGKQRHGKARQVWSKIWFVSNKVCKTERWVSRNQLAIRIREELSFKWKKSTSKKIIIFFSFLLFYYLIPFINGKNAFIITVIDLSVVDNAIPFKFYDLIFLWDLESRYGSM